MRATPAYYLAEILRGDLDNIFGGYFVLDKFGNKIREPTHDTDVVGIYKSYPFLPFLRNKIAKVYFYGKVWFLEVYKKRELRELEEALWAVRFDNCEYHDVVLKVNSGLSEEQMKEFAEIINKIYESFDKEKSIRKLIKLIEVLEKSNVTNIGYVYSSGAYTRPAVAGELRRYYISDSLKIKLKKIKLKFC
jgi:hypothetical protein